MTQTAKVKSVKSKDKILEVVDLFCGAGGTSSGVVSAVQSLGYDINLLAINHWDVAIATHTHNHPTAQHRCQSIDTLNPQDLIPGRRLNLLLASPECTDHSNAKGGKPRSDQKRADAWLLMRWIEKLYVENIIIENVKEFVNWGPLTAKGLPDKRHRGKYFRRFVEALEINYTVEWRILNCADYGDATTRERFFMICKRGKGRKIVFPEQTHASRKVIEKAKQQPGLFGDKSNLKPWRSAREIIDWKMEGKSIFGRKKPLSENTMKRIFAGLMKYSLKPFVFGAGGSTGQAPPRDIDEPMRTITGTPTFGLAEPFLVNLKGKHRSDRPTKEPTFAQCNANHQMLVEPFIIPCNHGKGDTRSHSVDEPMKAITSVDAWGVIEPFLVKFFGGQHSAPIDEPIPTITANYEHYGLAEPYIVSMRGTSEDAHNRSRNIDDPLPTITATVRTAGVVEPFIIPCAYAPKDKVKGDERCNSLEEPLGTVTGVNNWAFIEPFLVEYYGQSSTADVENPLPTVTAKDRFGLVEPFLVKFNTNNTDGAHSVDEPLGTITGKDRFGLCIPQIGAILDIRFRMLQPHELAAAMSFPEGYHFTGTRDQKVKQIGNAVPVRTAKALCAAVLNN